MTEPATTTFDFTTIQRITQEFLDKILDGTLGPTYLTGIPSLDNSVRGLRRGEMCVVGGRPSHGKSMLALQWAYNVAATCKNVLFISEEMGKEALAVRSLAFVNGLRDDEVNRGNYAQVADEQMDFWANKGKVVTLVSTGSVRKTTMAIEQAVKYLNVEMVFVDYLQLLSGPGGSTYERVTFVSRELKAAAVKNDIALVAMAQLARGLETRDNTPRLSDLKDSGQIEQDADQVLFVQWPLKSDPKYKPFDEYRVYCAKNRNREIKTNVIELRFVPSEQRLKEKQVKEMANYSPVFEQYNKGGEGF